MNANVADIKNLIESNYHDYDNPVLTSIKEKLQGEYMITTTCDDFKRPSKTESGDTIQVNYPSLCLEGKSDKQKFRGLAIKGDFHRDNDKVDFSIWTTDYLQNEILLMPMKTMDTEFLLQCLRDKSSFSACL